jgi:amino acid transporter
MAIFSRSTIEAMGRRKTVAEAKECSEESGVGLRRTLTAVDLVLFGVGSSVGAGIFVLVGLGTKLVGPAISLSFLGCGMTCILTSLAYAEFASRIPVAGSAFTYVYVRTPRKCPPSFFGTLAVISELTNLSSAHLQATLLSVNSSPGSAVSC